MQPKTITTLGTLRIGDRFCYPGKTDVWQVITGVTKSKTAINQFYANGERVHKYDLQRTNDTRVKFLRHTQLEFSDETTLGHLQTDDVFCLLSNIVIEYRVTRKIDWGATEFVTLADGKRTTLPNATEVVYLRKFEKK